MTNPKICPHCGGEGVHYPMRDTKRPCPEAAGSSWPYRTSRPAPAEGVDRPYAVIVDNSSRYTPPRSVPPTRWKVFLVGRETDKRLYRNAVKPPHWGHDHFETKAEALIDRFDTADAAEAFIQAARDTLASEIAELEAARLDGLLARDRAQAADLALRERTKAFWTERGQ